MPYTISNPPDRIKKLPSHAIEIFVSAFNSALKQYKNEQTANQVAWSAVKKMYKKEGDNWVKKSASESMKNLGIIFPVQTSDLKFAEESEMKTEIQVLSVGTWKHPVYGKIKISEKDIDDFVKNFDSKVRRDIAITEGHPVGEDEKPAIGWFRQLLNKGRDGLWAVVEWTEKGKKLLASKAYKYFSPEFYTNYEDPETHKNYLNVLVGGALTNRPYFKSLQAVVLSEMNFEENIMLKIEEIITKDLETLTDEEKDFLKEHKEELKDEDKEKFKTILEEKKENEETEEEETEEEEEENKGSEKTVTLSETVLKTLQNNASEGVKAMALLRKAKATEFTNSFVFSEKNQRGIILPKMQDSLTNFYLSLSEKQQIEFKSILDSIPKANLFSELGKEAGVSMKASEQAMKLAQDKMSKNDKLTLRQALSQVFAESPELTEKVEQE